MTTQYGPRATLMNAGSNLQFGHISAAAADDARADQPTSPVLSRRNLLWPVAAAVLLIVLPTIRRFRSGRGSEDGQ